MSVNPSSTMRLMARTASPNNDVGSKPKVSRTIPTTKETTISRTATIAGDPPAKRPTTLLVMTDDLDWQLSSRTAALACRRPPRVYTSDDGKGIHHVL